MQTKQPDSKQRWIMLAAAVVFGLALPATFLLPEPETDARPVEGPTESVAPSGSSHDAPGTRVDTPDPSSRQSVGTPLEQTPGYGDMLFKTVLALAAVCLLAYVALRWGLRRLYGRDDDTGAMAVLSRMRLGPNREVLVAKVGPRHLILSSTEQQLSVLGELSQQEVSDYFIDHVDPEGQDG